MEKGKPMDRLICADVGYGKTEVALRAAFKAVTDRKQVAILAPTTLLTQQHYHTLTSRFAPFKYRIELLNRFKTVKEQKEIVKGLADGKVDIVIGTHRLLQKDIKFQDLGLIVIDEEHRFGVKDKEHLKKMRETVDVLTLTATPIPRTLYLSLAGAKDISVLETPPRDRLPIKTIVTEYTPETIAEAIKRETERKGQVYFLYNEVQSIESFAHKVSRIVPEVRLGIAHGQMKKHVLEKVMLDFLAGNIDVLVCSTIIESGLDIPNVNTLLVHNADDFGLAQLHQLRGRVGRSDRQAYAYLFYHKGKVLTQDAYDRLHALKEFTALGSGYRIALKDLEIRGAGNILGTEQSGYIATIGFELFCRLLDDSVRESRGEKLPPEKKMVLDQKAEQYIPEEYIPDLRQRLAVYQRIMGAASDTELDELCREMEDRFGPMPETAEKLLMEVRKQL
jgi:transcription-repair coupling factor (superfamily II helicase)